MTGSTVRATAPLRLSFVGGGTDFPHYFERHGGAVLSSTIDHVVRVTITEREDRQVRVRSLDLGHLVEYHLDEGPQYDGVMDLAKAAIDRIGVTGGLEMTIDSQAPAGSGLGGSSALVTAVVAALAALKGAEMTTAELARLAYAIEREDLGVAGGWQDQYASVFGGLNLLEFTASDVSVTPVRTGPGVLERLRRNLLLCYSGGVRRDVGLIERQISLYHEGREDTILGMKELHEMAYAMRDALEAGDPDRLGAMLHEAFEAKRRMNPAIAEGTPIEAMLGAARGAGATGGKICGAGGGGYLLIYASTERQPSVRGALEALGGQLVPFALRSQGVWAERGGVRWAPV